MQLLITDPHSADYARLVGNSSRPRFHPTTNRAAHFAANGQLIANSRLDAREWKLLDTRVQTMQRTILTGINDLRARGLVQTIGSIGVFQVDKRIQSERRAADVTMRTSTRVDSDRAERKTISVPLPVVHTDYSIDERELAASRNMMTPLDTTEAEESSQAVSETLESMLFLGNSSVVFNGLAIKGYSNATGVLTDTATNLGGGDFATADNPYKTVVGALAALEAKRFYGPFMVYLNSVQYYEAALPRANTDTTGLQMIRNIGTDKIIDVKSVNSSNVAAGTMFVVQMTPDVVELQEAMPISNREWLTGDLSVFHGKVMAMLVPFIKVNYAGDAGIYKATGC